jgi:IS30 family transposase
MMCDLRRDRKTLREIAQAIGRSPSTVSRELRRNAEVRPISSSYRGEDRG